MKTPSDRKELAWKCAVFVIIALLGVLAAFYIFNSDPEGGAGISAEMAPVSENEISSIIRPRLAADSGDDAESGNQVSGQGHWGGFAMQATPRQRSSFSPMIPSGIHDSMLESVREEFERMQQAMDQMMGGGAFAPGFMGRGLGFAGPAATQGKSYSLSESPDRYTFKMDIPGLDNSSVDVRVKNNTLTVSGSRGEQIDRAAGGARSFSSSVSSFSYSFQLPGQISSNKPEVSFDNDTLTVVIPKH